MAGITFGIPSGLPLPEESSLQARGSTASSGTAVLYEYATTPAEVSLGKMVDPGTGNRHYLGIRATSSTGFLQLTLLQGTTTIQSWLLDASQTMDPLELLIDTAKADTITDYFDLHVRWQFFETLVPEVDEAYFLLPDGGMVVATTGDASSGSAQLSVDKYLTASGDAASDGSAFPGLLITTTSSGPAASDGAAQLDLTLDLTASGDAASAATVANGYIVDFAASGPTAADGTSDVTVDYSLDAAGPSASEGSVDVFVDLALNASGPAASDGKASTSILLDLTGSGATSSAGTATPSVNKYVTASGPAASDGTVANSMIREVSASGPTADQPHVVFAYTTTIAEVALGGVGQVPTDDQHFIYFRQIGNVTGGTLDITLLQGTTVIEAFTGIDARQTMDPLGLLVDSANAASITDYSNLRVRWQFFDVFGVIEVDEVWMELPSEGLSASAPTASDGSVSLNVTSNVTASGGSASDGAAALAVSLDLTASGATAASGSIGFLEEDSYLTASGGNASSGSIPLLLEDSYLTANGATATTGAVSIEIDQELTASGAAASSGSMFTLTIDLFLTASGAAAASGSIAFLEEDSYLTASGASAADGFVNIELDIELVASGASSSFGVVNIFTNEITASGATSSHGRAVFTIFHVANASQIAVEIISPTQLQLGARASRQDVEIIHLDPQPLTETHTNDIVVEILFLDRVDNTYTNDIEVELLHAELYYAIARELQVEVLTSGTTYIPEARADVTPTITASAAAVNVRERALKVYGASGSKRNVTQRGKVNA